MKQRDIIRRLTPTMTLLGFVLSYASIAQAETQTIKVGMTSVLESNKPKHSEHLNIVVSGLSESLTKLNYAATFTQAPEDCQALSCAKKALTGGGYKMVVKWEVKSKGLMGIGSHCRVSLHGFNKNDKSVLEDEITVSCRASGAREALPILEESLQEWHKARVVAQKTRDLTACHENQALLPQAFAKALRKRLHASPDAQLGLRYLRTHSFTSQNKACLKLKWPVLKEQVIEEVHALARGACTNPDQAPMGPLSECLGHVERFEIWSPAVMAMLTNREYNLVAKAKKDAAKIRKAHHELTTVFRGCGQNQDEARSRLAGIIGTYVQQSATDSVAQLGDSTQQKVDTHLEVHTATLLQNLRYEQRGQEVCAVESTRDLKRSLRATAQLDVDCSISKKASEEELHESLSACTMRAGFLTYVAPLFWDELSPSERRQVKRAAKELPELKQRLSAIQLQNVRFEVTEPGATIELNGKSHAPSKTISTGVGTYSYRITAPGYCPLEGSVNIAYKETLTKTISLKGRTLPKITLLSDLAGARGELNGKPVTLGQPVTLQVCSGRASYGFLGGDADDQTNSFKLKPGIDRKLRDRRMTHTTRKRLNTVAGRVTSGALIEAGYSARVPMADGLSDTLIHALDVNQLHNHGAFHYGYGGAAGVGGGGSFLLEATVMAGVHMTEFAQDPLHIAKALPVIPYLRVNLGLGHHQTAKPDGTTQSDYGSFAKTMLVMNLQAGARVAINDELYVDMGGMLHYLQDRQIGLRVALGGRWD